MVQRPPLGSGRQKSTEMRVPYLTQVLCMTPIEPDGLSPHLPPRMKPPPGPC